MVDAHERQTEVGGCRPAIFASSFHPNLGGVEELVRQLAHAQAAAGRTPVIHTMRWPRSLPSHEIWEGLDVRRHSFRAPEGGSRRIGAAAVGNPLVLADVVRQLRSDRADIVHVECVSLGAWFAHRAARILKLPLVVTLQGELTMDATQVFERSAPMRHTMRLVLRDADQVTACSAATLREAETWRGEPFGPRGRVVPNGVDVDDFATGSEAAGFWQGGPYIAALGRHVREKGFDVLLDAFADAADRSVGALPSNWGLVIAGDGPDRQELERRAATLGLGSRVVFMGRLDRTDVARLLTHADLFVLPSRHEPFGIVNLEAMAAGTPVIASDVGGVSEFVVNEVNGLLVRAADPRMMADALVRLSNDHALRESLVASARRTAAEHSWTALEKRYADVYRSAIVARAGSAGGA